MKPNRRRAAVDIAEREAIAETRRRLYEALERGMPMAEAVAYAQGETPVAPPPVASEPSGAPAPVQSEADLRAARRAVDLAGWEDLPYVPRTAGAPNLKALATQVATGPIRNKADAEAAIRAELDLRAKEDGEQRGAIDIPEGWQGLPLGEQIVIASQFSADEIKTEGDVERVIQTELARRAG
ncbi:MAG: hypothetical protein WA975_18220 [Mesorhizobium sp.]